MKVKITQVCVYEVTDDEAERLDLYNATDDESVMAMEREIASDDPGYLLELGEDWTITVERA